MAIRLDAHRDEFHRDQQWHKPCRVATTANVTIASALNAGDTIDGVTLAAGDRVLVKDQSTGSQNGIYIAGASPARAYDMLTGVQALGAYVHVLDGTASGSTLWRNTNTSLPTIDSTALTWEEFSGGASGLDVTDGSTTVTPTSEIEFDSSSFQVTDQGGGSALVEFIGAGGGGKYDPDAAPATAASLSDEFDAGTVNGAWSWTGTTPAVFNETTYPGYLYVEIPTANNPGAFVRAYAPGASTAFTYVVKGSFGSRDGDVAGSWGMGVLDSSNANICIITHVGGSSAPRWAQSRLSINGSLTNFGGFPGGGVDSYLMMQRDTSNIYRLYFSVDGKVWSLVGTTAAISTTVAKIALLNNTNLASIYHQAFDFVRVWTSASIFKIGS